MRCTLPCCIFRSIYFKYLQLHLWRWRISQMGAVSILTNRKKSCPISPSGLLSSTDSVVAIWSFTADRHRCISLPDFNRFTGTQIPATAFIGAARRFHNGSSSLWVTAGSSAKAQGLWDSYCCSRGDDPAPVTGTAQPQCQFIMYSRNASIAPLIVTRCVIRGYCSYIGSFCCL